MTTLAIIGNGIAGRSLIYTLAKEKKSFEKITLFYSDTFATPCSLHSTAVVAPRGLSSGHSALGDLLMDGFREFSDHVALDHPLGVESIVQYTGATQKLETFKARYPLGMTGKKFGPLALLNETYVATEEAFLINPQTYLEWLSTETRAMSEFQLEELDDFVLEVEELERVHIKTHKGRSLVFDKVIFTAGNYARFWTPLVPDSKLKTSKPIPGAYLEFNELDWKFPSISLTLDGDNLIWNAPIRRLLIGSTTSDHSHSMAPIQELKDIWSRVQKKVDVELPSFERGLVKVGLREKAQKREPYLFGNGKKVFLGGLYKNGFSLSLKMAKSLSHQFLSPAYKIL